MTRTLIPCPQCSRHVAAGARSCPFCDAELPAAASPAPRAAVRLSRAAIFAGAAALAGAGAAVACGGAQTGAAQDERLPHAELDAGPDAQPELPPDDDWRYRRRNCDECPYGAPALPFDRLLV